MEYTAGEIDPRRPWIRDPEDAPASMNWLQTLLNPFGRASKVHFTRAWTFMFMGRVLLYLVPSVILGVAGLAGVSTQAANVPVDLIVFTVPAVLLPFALFTLLTEYTSFAAHLRRLSQAGRNPFLAILVLVPLLTAMMLYTLGAGMGAARYDRIHSPPASSAEMIVEGQGGQAQAGEPESSARAAGREGRGARGPRAQKMKDISQRQMAVSAGMGLALPVWGLLSFCVMLWTLFFVARLPNPSKE